MVFDGHGKEGDLCALYCRDHLPNAVAKVSLHTYHILAHYKMHMCDAYTCQNVDIKLVLHR
jgi:hypothetical protein